MALGKTKIRMRSLILIALTESLTACSGSSSDTNGNGFTPVTCDSVIVASCTSEDGVCEGYGAPLDEKYISNFKKGCVDAHWTFSPGPCPSVGLVGGCATGVVLVEYYSRPTAVLAAADVIRTCAAFGGTYCPLAVPSTN